MVRIEKRFNGVQLPCPEEWDDDEFANSIYIKGIKEIVALTNFVRLELTTGTITTIFTMVH
jgi:hypothetical protein